MGRSGCLSLRWKHWGEPEKQGPQTRPFSCAHSSLAGCCAGATATAGAASGAGAAGGAAATAGAGISGNSGLGNGGGAGAGHGVSPVGGGWRKRVCRLRESSIHPPVEGRVKGEKGGSPSRTAKGGRGAAKEASANTSPRTCWSGGKTSAPPRSWSLGVRSTAVLLKLDEQVVLGPVNQSYR